MQPDMYATLYNEYVTGERDYYNDMEMREWMYAELYNEDNIDDISYDEEEQLNKRRLARELRWMPAQYKGYYS